MMSVQDKRALGLLRRVGGVVVFILAALLYLQFALQAFFAAPSQALLVLVASAAFGVAAVRFLRYQGVAHIVFGGTLPLFVFSLATTFIYSDESPVFAIIFGLAPALSGMAWMLRK